MKVISAVTIGKLIEAHMEHDEQKFLSYANFIAEAYEKQGEERKARIIRKRLDGTYKNDPQITLDSADCGNDWKNNLMKKFNKVE